MTLNVCGKIRIYLKIKVVKAGEVFSEGVVQVVHMNIYIAKQNDVGRDSSESDEVLNELTLVSERADIQEAEIDGAVVVGVSCLSQAGKEVKIRSPARVAARTASYGPVCATGGGTERCLSSRSAAVYWKRAAPGWRRRDRASRGGLTR